MRKGIKLLIVEIVLAIIVIIMFVMMFRLNLDLKVLKFIPIQNVLAERIKISNARENFEIEKNKYQDAVKNLNEQKGQYEKQKNDYLAITDETINLIREETADEKFDIEYMWITLGNYAKKNNLEIYLVEPGGEPLVEESEEEKEDSEEKEDKEISGNINDANDAKEAVDKMDPTKGDLKENLNTLIPPTKDDEISKLEDMVNKSEEDDEDEFKIKVRGNYTNLAEFVFDIENDRSLRFKLDKINMELISGTKLEASFAVKNLNFIK